MLRSPWYIRKHRLLIVLGAIAGAAPLATAQTTWRNLRFGMTEAEVKAVLGADAHQCKQAEKSVPACLDIDVSIDTVPGSATLAFDKSTKRLTHIVIGLHPDKLAKDSDKVVSVSIMLESLENKYGEPFRTKDGTVISPDIGPMDRDVTWRTKDQVIDWHIFRTAEGIPTFIILSYGPITGIKDL